jgi:hypothetical protein
LSEVTDEGVVDVEIVFDGQDLPCMDPGVGGWNLEEMIRTE